MDSYEILNLKKKKKKTSYFHEMELSNLFLEKGRFQKSFDFIFRMKEIRIFKSVEGKQIEERID